MRGGGENSPPASPHRILRNDLDEQHLGEAGRRRPSRPGNHLHQPPGPLGHCLPTPGRRTPPAQGVRENSLTASLTASLHLIRHNTPQGGREAALPAPAKTPPERSHGTPVLPP